MTAVVREHGNGMAADHAALVARARARLRDEDLLAVVADLVAVPSPTGGEAPLAALAAGRLAAAGARAGTQDLGPGSANAVARIGRADGGARLLVYAPLDTAFTTDPALDRPFLGDRPRADFALPPSIGADRVVGLGAENPKGFAAAGLAALAALAPEEGLLPGEVVLGLVAGSMPVGTGEGTPVGHGAGIDALLDTVSPDAAVVLKPGWAVVHEEVGYAWFRVTVRGAVGYTGIRHKAPYRNPVLGAARLVAALEPWLAAWAERWADGLVAPQGSVNAIRGGDPDRASFVPATASFELDLRLGPRTSADAAEAELRAALPALAAETDGLEVEVARLASVPGGATDPGHWLVRTATDAWERLEGVPHALPARQSGASDVGRVRARGIPAVRIGLPPAQAPDPAYGGFSMGVVEVAQVRRLAELLVDVMASVAARTSDGGAVRPVF